MIKNNSFPEMAIQCCTPAWLRCRSCLN